MAVPEGIPFMLVFIGLFAFLVLFGACIVLSIVVKDTLVRVGLVAAAVLLAVVMGIGAFFTMVGGEEEAKEEEIVVEQPPAPKPAPATPQAPESGNVVLVVDESTITGDYDALQTDRLSVEEPARGKTGSIGAQQERAKVGKEITAIEQNLNKHLLALDSQVQEVKRRFDAQEMENYDMIFWQAKLKKQQYGFIVRAMDEKQKLLEKATTISSEEKAADMARIDKRRQAALDKWREYHGVLAELTANQDALRAL